MLAQPSSRLIFGVLPWYSVLIVSGMIIAILLAIKEEKKVGLPEDSVLSLVLWLIPFSIIGARIYFVIFSWSYYAEDLTRIFKIWEGGMAIYGGIIAGLITAFVFSKVKNLSFLSFCDIIAPGLVLAQGIGRWGNYFNMEAYGLPITDPSLQFFPFGVLINEGSTQVWHMATFFYESLADILIAVVLLVFRHKYMKRRGDVFCWYILLYGAARLITEHYRMDSLFTTGGQFRISQILSVLMCIGVCLYFTVRTFSLRGLLSGRKRIIVPWISIAVCFALFLRLRIKGGSCDPFMFYFYAFFALCCIQLTDMILMILSPVHPLRDRILPCFALIILLFWFLLYSHLYTESVTTVASSSVLLALFSISAILNGIIVFKTGNQDSCLDSPD